MKEIRALRAAAELHPASPVVVESAPRRPLKRTRSISKIFPQDDPGERLRVLHSQPTPFLTSTRLVVVETTPKRQRSASAMRVSQLRLHLLSSSAEKSGILHPSSGEFIHLQVAVVCLVLTSRCADDSVTESPRPWPVDTPESVLRGPSLPGLGETVLSPALAKPAVDDNPGSGAYSLLWLLRGPHAQ